MGKEPDNPFNMSPDEIAMWMSEGAAQPGSVRYEEARAAMEWELAAQARREAKRGRTVAIVAATASTVAAVAAVVGVIVSA